MKLNIFSKLFLVLSLSMVVLLGAVFTSVLWTFQHGFINYLQAVQADRLNEVILRLQKAYADHGSWEFLRDNEQQWQLLLRGLRERNEPAWPPERPPEAPPPDRPADADDPGSGPQRDPSGQPLGGPPGGPDFFPGHRHHGPSLFADPLFPFGHLRVLDAAKQQVAGPRFRSLPEQLRPIGDGNNVVGWVSVGQNPIITDKLATAFLQEQTRSSYLIAGLALLLAVAAAMGLARQVVRPIRQLAAGVRALGQGNFNNEIKVGTRDELGQLAADINLLGLTLQRNEQQRRMWITDFSHELRTPLAILRSELEALQAGIRSPSPERINSLHNEVLAIGELIDDLYDLSLSDIGAMQYHKEMLDLTPLLLRAIESFQVRFTDRLIRLENRINPQISAPVFGDAKRLKQLFDNLLENSYRYTDRGGQCEVAMRVGPSSVRIQLIDSAPGVPADDLPRIFDRLYRAGNTRGVVGGAGLGLALCKNIVTAHAGSIKAMPAAAGGLQMCVDLPLAKA